MTAWQDKDRRHCWHPFTQHGTEGDAIVIERAKGASLFDENGREILDLISSWWTCLHGHAHPAINAALAEQAARMEHVMYAGFSHPPAIDLAEKLAARLPGDLNRVFYSDNGSTAVEVALKIAYQSWKNKGLEGRTTFIAFEGGYHGDTLGAMSVGKGCGFFRLYEGLMFSVETAPFPATWDGDAGAQAKVEEAMAAFRRLLDSHEDQIAGVVLEPLLQGAGGMRVCDPAFMRAVTDEAQARGIPVIYDEVAVGFGRTGTLFACERIGAVPDLICLSKGLTAGYMPLSVTVATDRLYNAFMGESFRKALAHGHSFTANPLACAVALKSLALFEEEDTMARIADIERRHRAQLPALQNHPAACRARVLGTILAFDLSGAAAGYKSEVSEKLRARFLAEGLNIRPIGDTVYLLPPYCVTGAELARAYDGIIRALDDLAPQSARTRSSM